MATVLSKTSEIQQWRKASLHHGFLGLNKDFEPMECREYSLLRMGDLYFGTLTGSPPGINSGRRPN